MNRPFPDQLGRPLRDLRISVTDRCNFRCTYCMPKEVFGTGYRFLPPDEMLSFQEIARLAGIFVSLGVRKLRITGGEPLLRHRLPDLVRMLAGIDGVEDLTLTTNGSLLPALAAPLRAAGLDRITVSLDSLDEAVFQGMNDARFPVSGVLAGISSALDAGFAPVKINMVVKRGVNEGSIIPMARRFRNSGCIVRFIEYMDVGNANGWRLEEVVPAAEILQILNAEFPLEAMESFGIGEVASRYRYRDGGGEIGIISSVTQPFCRGCTRARISSDGALYTCLFASDGCDLRGLLRSGSDDEEIAERIREVWSGREDRYSELRHARSVTAPKVEMSRIGG